MTPRWRGTVLYPAALVGLFLGSQLLLGLLGVAEAQRAALAALPAVAALLISLPQRLRRVWGSAEPWRRLGVRRTAASVTRGLVRGLLKALLLLALVAAGLTLAGQISWQPHLSTGLALNALALGLGVGFAEELLFRGWLLGELSLLVGAQRALWLQAALFSLVHTRFNLPPSNCSACWAGCCCLVWPWGCSAAPMTTCSGELWACTGGLWGAGSC